MRRGRFATVVDGRAPNAGAIAEGCARACLVAVVPAPGEARTLRLAFTVADGPDAAAARADLASSPSGLVRAAFDELERHGVFG